MRLNFAGWKEEDIRPTFDGFQLKIMDFSVNKHRWMTLEEITEICRSDGSFNSKLFREFTQKALDRIDAVKKIMEENGFEKIYLKTFSDEKSTVADIVQFKYGDVVSAPRLMITLAFNDFYYKVPSWGIDDEILIDAKKYGVEDIYLIDDYNNWHFYTTMNKLNILGESMHWGKTYLPLKHFKVYKYGSRVPNYQKFLSGIEIHENN